MDEHSPNELEISIRDENLPNGSSGHWCIEANRSGAQSGRRGAGSGGVEAHDLRAKPASTAEEKSCPARNQGADHGNAVSLG